MAVTVLLANDYSVLAMKKCMAGFVVLLMIRFVVCDTISSINLFHLFVIKFRFCIKSYLFIC